MSKARGSKTVCVNVRMTPRQFHALDTVATNRDKTVSEVVRELVDRALLNQTQIVSTNEELAHAL